MGDSPAEIIVKEQPRKQMPFLNGAVSAISAAFFNQHFHVMKCRMMTEYWSTGKLYTNKQIRKKNLQTHGIFQFYRGFRVNSFRTMIGTGTYFSALEHLKKIFAYFQFSNHVSYFLSSSFARFLQISLTKPIQEAMVIYQAKPTVYKSTIDALIGIHREGGISKLYQGYFSLLIKEIPSAGLFYLIYEKLKLISESFGIKNLALQASLSSIFSNFVITFINHPLDVTITRMKYYNQGSWIENLFAIYRKDGLKGLYLGILPRLMKRSIGGAIGWTVYEGLKKDQTLGTTKARKIIFWTAMGLFTMLFIFVMVSIYIVNKVL